MYHTNFNFECNTERGFKESLSTALGLHTYVGSYSFLELMKDKAKKSEEHHILVLGCSEAGKSTFIKQMQIIHSSGLGSNSARLDKKELIAGNIMSAIGTLVREMSFVQENQLHDIEELSEAVGRLFKMPHFPHEATFN